MFGWGRRIVWSLQGHRRLWSFFQFRQWLRLFRDLKISYVTVAITFQYYMCGVREITIVSLVQSSLLSNLKLLIIGQKHDTYNELVLLKFTWWTLKQKAGSEIRVPIKQGHPTSIFGKYLFGRRFEIYNFRNICCKISCTGRKNGFASNLLSANTVQICANWGINGFFVSGSMSCFVNLVLAYIRPKFSPRPNSNDELRTNRIEPTATDLIIVFDVWV